MTGAINMGGQDITNTGYITMNPDRYIQVSNLTSAQETTLIATPLGAGNAGAVWYNSTDNDMKLWNGSAVNALIQNNGQPGAITVGPSDANALTFNTSNTARVTIDSSGNVGVGTSSPTASLDISNNTANVTLTKIETTGVGASNKFMSFRQSGTETGYISPIQLAMIAYNGFQGAGTGATVRSFGIGSAIYGADNNGNGAGVYGYGGGSAGHGAGVVGQSPNNPAIIAESLGATNDTMIVSSKTITSARMLYLEQLGSAYTGDALQMNLGQSGGSFSGNFVNLKNNGTSEFIVKSTGDVGIGTATPNSSALLDVYSTTKGALIPRMTTAQRDAIASPANGLQIYNTTTNSLDYYNGTAWQEVGIAGAGITSFNGQTGSTQTLAVGTAGTAPAWNSAANSHTLNIPMASTAGTTAGLLSNADYTTFNNKLGTSTTFSGDVSGTYNATSVDKIKGTAVSATAPTSGQFLVYDGATNYAPVKISGDATMSTTGVLAIANNAITSAKINATGIGTNEILMTDGTTGSSVTYATCANGDVMSWVTGTGWSCTSVSSLLGNGYLVNGGQTGAVSAGSTDASTLTLMTNNSSRMTIDSSGDVGFGTTTPGYTFEVESDSAAVSPSALTLYNGTSGANLGEGLLFASKTPGGVANTNQASIVAAWDGGNAYGDLFFKTGVGGTLATQMFLGFGGNLGIGSGATVNNAGLDVHNTADAYSNAAANGMDMRSTLVAQANGDSLNGVYINPTYNDNGMTGVEHNGLIVASGNVGIGTASPAANLVVDSATSASLLVTNSAPTSNPFSSIRLQNYRGVYGVGDPSIVSWVAAGTAAAPAAVRSGMKIMSLEARGYGDSSPTWSNSESGWIDWTASSTWLGGGDRPSYMTVGTSGLERMRIDKSGNVGIGTTTPSSLLDVNGALTLEGMAGPALSPAGQGRIYFDSTANQFEVSENGGAYATLATTGGSGGGQSSTSSLTFNSNSDNTGSDGGFNFQSNGANLLTIANNGDSVFTSTTASTSSSTGALVVDGGIGIAGNINAAGTLTVPQIYGSSAASGDIKIDGTSNATAGNVLLAAAGGNVGIGTGTPGAKLGVYGGDLTVTTSTRETAALWGTDGFPGYGSDSYLRVGNTSSAVNTGSEILFGSEPNGSAQTDIAAVEGKLIATGGSTWQGALTFATADNTTTLTERMRIDNAGNVGIGTATPGVSLDLHSRTDAIALPSGTTAQEPSAPMAGYLRYNSSNSVLEFYNGSSWQQVVGGSAVDPAGLIGAFPMTCPSGWLEADGSAISRATYGSLFAVIGTSYGSGDGSTTFNLPDYRGYFLRGWDHGAGNDPGAASRAARGDGTSGDNIGTVEADEMQGHDHKTANINGSTSASWNLTGGGGSFYTGPTTYTSGGPVSDGVDGTPRTGPETRPKNINVIYCISTATNSATTVASTGSGTTNYVPAWTSSTSLGDSPIAVSGGNVGIGTTSPATTLDVNGSMRLAKNSAQPYACDSSHDGAIALTSIYTMCACRSGMGWVSTTNGSSSCYWAATPVSLTISANTQNYNIYTAAGSPSYPVTVTLTINSAVTVGSSSASTAALITGNLPVGSTVTIVNNGSIIGAGGAGGAGGSSVAGTSGSNGSDGQNGGDAISTTVALTIDNTNGSIFGGGGGAGGGGGGYGTVSGARGAGGGGGGGGAGSTGGAGGAAGIANDGRNGGAGSAGSTTGGAGGTGYSINQELSTGAGWGGGSTDEGGPVSGGGYGQAGGAGLRGVTFNGTTYVTVSNGGAAGAAGYAVHLNGNSITWVGGNTPAQVKGNVL